MGHQRSKSQGQVLPADRDGQSPAGAATRSMVAARQCDWTHHESGGERGLAMRPKDDDLDAEIRGHLAINVQQRIERGEDPDVARLAALREFGYVPQLR